ncbi:hypothetical protein BGX20_000264, partial [Mortierella sp. AD010]
MAVIRKLGLVLAAVSVFSLSLIAQTDAAGCKYNNGLVCPQETPCCSAHGHCSNSPIACGVGCDASASFNGRCVRRTSTQSALINNKPQPVPSLPKGSFKVVGDSGVAAQHIVLVTPTKMLIIDKAEANPPKLPSGTSAYNVEYDLVKNDFRVLEVQTNTFCSGGGFLPNGTMISAGGAEMRRSRAFVTGTGFQSLRMWNPCDNKSCGWIESPEDPAWTMTSNR